jgi:hypothetical protein
MKVAGQLTQVGENDHQRDSSDGILQDFLESGVHENVPGEEEDPEDEDGHLDNETC